MKDIGTVLQTAYYTALHNTTTTIAGANVPAYDRVPNTVDYPYIRLGEFTAVDDGDKNTFGVDVTFSLEVVTGYDSNAGGKAEAHYISDQVIQIIRVRTAGLLDLSPNFNMITSMLDNTTSVEENGATHQIYKRLIRFRHLVEEL